MKIELMESFGIVMVVYMLVMLFSDIDNRFIDRSVFQELRAAVKASVVLVCVTALTIFLQHNNAEASRGVYFCIALVNMCLYFGMHIIIKYIRCVFTSNKDANNQDISGHNGRTCGRGDRGCRPFRRLDPSSCKYCDH